MNFDFNTQEISVLVEAIEQFEIGHATKGEVKICCTMHAKICYVLLDQIRLLQGSEKMQVNDGK